MSAFNDDALHADDAATLQQLAASSDLDRPREQLHFFLFVTEECARDALARAAEDGWEPHGEIHEITGVPDGAPPLTHPWAAAVRRADMAVNSETLPRIRTFFEDLCTMFDGLYDGWEAATDEQLDDAITMEELNDEELEFLVKLRQLAKKIEITDDLPAIQRCFARYRAEWHATKPKKRFDPDAIIHTLGVACGDLIAHELDLRWVRLTDQHGTDFALISELGDASGINVFPINAASTRWHDPAKPGLDEYVEDVLEWAEEND